MNTPRVLRAATRASPLALWQTERVKALLEASGDVEVEIVSMTSAPDRDLTQPLSAIGGKGAFAKEVQQAVLDGRADFAVHSAKDLPSTTVAGLVLASVPERGDQRDGLVGCAFADLPPGAVIATGSARRRVQLADVRPDLRFVELRGNIQRRVAAADGDDIDAVVVAGVALERQGMVDSLADWLDPTLMTPQVGQGALAVECRADAPDIAAALATIEDPVARRLVAAERSYLVALGGDCELPAGAHARLDGDDVELRVVLATFDGSRVERRVVRGADGDALGPLALTDLPVDDLLG